MGKMLHGLITGFTPVLNTVRKGWKRIDDEPTLLHPDQHKIKGVWPCKACESCWSLQKQTLPANPFRFPPR